MAYLAHPDFELDDLGLYSNLSKSRVLPCNEGAMKGHHAYESITCLLQLQDEFVDFSSFSLISAPLRPMVNLITKLNLESIRTLIYAIKPRIKISVSVDILVFEFYGYIGLYSVDFFKKY